MRTLQDTQISIATKPLNKSIANGNSQAVHLGCTMVMGRKLMTTNAANEPRANSRAVCESGNRRERTRFACWLSLDNLPCAELDLYCLYVLPAFGSFQDLSAVCYVIPFYHATID